MSSGGPQRLRESSLRFRLTHRKTKDWQFLLLERVGVEGVDILSRCVSKGPTNDPPDPPQRWSSLTYVDCGAFVRRKKQQRRDCISVNQKRETPLRETFGVTPRTSDHSGLQGSYSGSTSCVRFSHFKLSLKKETLFCTLIQRREMGRLMSTH